MPETTDADQTPPQSFHPQDADTLWKLVTMPHPVIGKARHLGEALLHSGLVAPSTLADSLKIQQLEREQGSDRPIGQILIDHGNLTQDQLRQVIASWLGEYMVHPGSLTPDPVALALVPRAIAERESVLPLLAREDAVVLLMADPYDRVLLDELRFLTQRRLIPLLAAPGTLTPAIAKAYNPQPGDKPAPTSAPPKTTNGSRTAPAAVRATSQELALNLTHTAPENDSAQADVVSESDNTLVRLINSVITEAIAHRASDIHIETEPAPQDVHIRLRVDGDLMHYLNLPARFRFALVARIKVMAGMDISEHRKPQDGKIDFSRFGGPPVELRVVTVPTSRGLEDVVLRLLEIGIDPFNFSDSLLAILAQRLVRRLCPACREARPADMDTLLGMASQYLESGTDNTAEARAAQVERWRQTHGSSTGEITLWQRRGCSQCEEHGYRGRLGIHELMLSDDTLRQHIRHRAPASDIRHSALAAGMLTLRQDGIEKVLQGLTDMSEVVAATNL